MRKLCIYVALALLLIVPGTHAASEFKTTSWEITDTTLRPNTDSTEDIGASGREVAEIYVDTLYVGTVNGVTGSVQFSAGSFTLGGVEITTSTTPGYESDNNATSIVWADGETSPAQVTFRVPTNYSSGAGLRVLADSSAVTTACEVDFAVYVNSDGSVWDSAATDQTPVALAEAAGTAELVTFSIATDFAALTAGQWVTVDIWRDNTATGTDDLEIYFLEFYYTRSS